MVWKCDIDVPNSIWNRYMKRYGDRYRLVKDEINVWHLKCRYGSVQLYSMVKHLLCFVGVFRSVRHKNAFIVRMPSYAFISQEGDWDIVVVFSEKNLDSLAGALLLYKKKKISDGYHRVLVERVKQARLAKKKKI